ncbi:MAG: TetR/AcrR family transcriptional regulator [Bdellovibrionota bacterium]
MARLTEDQIELNRNRILSAAEREFSKRGYNGVTIRDIAKKTKLPLGSHYNYYADKLALFEAVIDRCSREFLQIENPVVRYFLDSSFPDDLPRLAAAIKTSVESHESYFKLMYVDVVEFDGVHIRETFSNLDEKFRGAMGVKFQELGLLGRERNVDPSFALVSFYLSVYQYFIITRLFGASKVFGKRSEQQVIEGLIEIFRRGIDGRNH